MMKIEWRYIAKELVLDLLRSRLFSNLRVFVSLWLFLFLLIAVVLPVNAQIPTFTETYSSYGNLEDNNNNVWGGYLRSGYAYAYYPDDYYHYDWGNIAYCSNSLYVVWADDRVDGYNNIYLAKINSANGASVWSTNFQVNTLDGSMYRPSIFVKDKSHIYVSWSRSYGGLWYLYTQRFIDNGTSLTPQWEAGSDKRIDDGSPGPNDMHWWVGDTEITAGDGTDNSAYITGTWYWTGSGDYTYLYSVSEDGSSVHGEVQTPYRSDNGEYQYFYRADSLLTLNNYIYVFAYKWAWNSSTYKGDRGPVLAKNTNSSSLARLNNGIYTTKRDPWNLSYAQGYIKHSIALSTNSQYLYFVWNDYRDGDFDVWIQRMSVDNNSDLSNYGGGTGGGTWLNDVKVNNSVSGRQVTPAVAVNPFNNKIYVVYRDMDENRLEYDKVSSDGTVDTGSDIVLASYRNHQPKIAVDNTDSGNYFYVAWLKYYGGRRYIEVAKFNENGDQQWINSNVVAVTYKTKSHSISKQLSFTPPALSVKKATLTNLSVTSNGYNIEFYVSHNGGNDWFSITNNKSVVFDTPGWEFKYRIVMEGSGTSEARIDSFTIKASKYYTGDLLYSLSSNTGYAGENVIEHLGTYQKTNLNIIANGTNEGVYFVRLKNTGNTNANFYIYGNEGNTYFDVQYYDGAANITSLVTSWTGLLVPNLAGGSNKTIRVEITPTTNTIEGQEFYLYLYSYVDKGVGLHDSIRLKATSWKYRPDLAIKLNDSDDYLGTNIYEYPTPSVQQIATNANSLLLNYEEKHTNYVSIKNNGVWTDSIKLSINTNVTLCSKTNWSIYITNLSLNQKVTPPYTFSLPPGQSNIFAFLIYPKISVVTNSVLTLDLLANSLNTIPSDDPLRMETAKITYQVFKKQSDLFIAPDRFFISRTGENLYSWTNTVMTQYLLLKTVPDRDLSFFVRLKNNGESVDTINFHIGTPSNTNWSISYKLKVGASYIDKTSILTNSSGTNFNMNPGDYNSFELVFTPNTNVPSGEWLNIPVIAFSSNKPYVQDVVYVRPYNKKLRPDVLISSNTNSSSFIGDNFYETNGATQYLYNRLEIDKDKATNYIKVINKSPTEQDEIVLWGEGSTEFTNWTINYYNFTNSEDITAEVTSSNGYSVILQTNESFLMKLVVFPKATTFPDEKIDIHFKAYSEEVTSQQDIVVFSNIGVELIPDFKFSDNSGNNIYRTNDYSYQNKSTIIIAGVTNTNITIKVENDGGSIESFKVISKASNIDGSITNWVINYYDVLNSQNITSLITNIGVIFTNMSPSSNRSIALKIYAKWYGDSSTNSAVSNKINIKFDVQSVTKPSRRDVGSVVGTIKRGLPDIYFDTNSIAENYYSPNFSTTNRLYLPVLKYIPVEILMISKNRGVYKDDFGIRTVVSNGDNWDFSFTNNGNDITSTITGSGLVASNLAQNGSVWIYSTFRATNGGIGDKVYFYNYFDTLSQRIQKDRVWMVGEITRGVPDIVGTNLVDNSSAGWGIYATNEQFYNNIMDGETNRYKLYLHNDITGGSNDNFILKQILKDSELTVKYYTNGTEISESDMTNGINLKINSDSYIPLEVLLNADSVLADAIKDIKWQLSLSGHSDYYDEFLIKTKKVSVQPDLIVKDSTSQYGYGVYTNNYEAFQGNTDIISGTTNNDITFRLENDGNSVENYRIKSFWSNIGGNRTNWVVQYIDKNTLLDITDQITNTGYVYNLNAGEYREIEVKVYAKVYDISSTNSAVKNKIRINCFTRSETRTNIIDTVSALGEIRKGLPDIYCPEPLTAQNFITNSFVDTNKIVVGVVLGYPSRIEIRYGNIGIVQDVFKYYTVMESNQNWSYAWTNIYSGDDITSQVTNTNQGYISTNNSGGYDVERIRLTLKANSGSVGDSIYFYNYLDTVSQKLRRDVLWVVGKIVDGLPDIACSNYQNNNVYGWGKDATNESTFNLIEDGETNIYDLLLHNEAIGGSNALFVLKQISKSSPVNLEYFTNGVSIPESDITNGLQIRINSDSVRKVQVKMSQNSASPDSWLKAQWKFYLKDYPGVYDTFTITNKKVEFKPDLWITTSSWLGNNIYTNDYDIQQTTLDVISGVTNSSLKLRIENDGGSVESYRIKASWSNIVGAYSNWIVRFYDKISGTEITSDVTNQGYLYANLSQNQYKDIDVKIYPKFYGENTTNSAVGNSLKLFFEEYSETRNWHLDRGSAIATIKRGIPDTYFVEGNKGIGIVTNQFINTNKLHMGAVIGYPESEVFNFQNIGSYEDSFNLIMYVASNQGSWDISVTNIDASQNITALVTNTNIGFSWTNNIGDTHSFKITLNPTNGSIGDKIYIYGKFRTKTLKLREDYFWIVGEIAEGIPDIAYSNIITERAKGIGKSNPDETMFNLIEQNYTNFYDILLKNEVTGLTPSVFVFQEIYRSAPQSPFIEYSTNGTVISQSVVSNGLNLSFLPQEIKKVRLKVNLDNFEADNKLILRHKFYLQNSTNVYDTFTLTNKKVEISPDLVLTVTNTNIGYGIVTNIYNIQSATQIFFSGVENTNIRFNLINKGGSTERYKFYSWWSNIGGEKSDWIVKYYKLPSLQDITYFVTNKNYGGNPTNFTGNDVFNMTGQSTNKIKLSIKPEWFGTGVTNSAVGNKIRLYVKFYSTSLTDNYDTGMVSGTIKRGLPDVYMTNQGLFKAKDLITNQYISDNTTNIIIYPYEIKQMFLKLNNIGSYTDIFRFTINLVKSNQTPWQFSITNTENSNDITSIVTNTNIGIIITNLGELGNYKITVTATNGRLNDKLLFYARLDTLTEKKREDRALVGYSLIGGIPDIACSNNQTGLISGWGRTSSNEFSFDRLEKQQTNKYTLLLHNEMHGSGESEFIFKETDLNARTNISVKYFTNSTEIAYANVTNGVHIFLPADDYKELIVQINGSNLNSGEGLSLKYKLWYINNTNLTDTFTLTNLRVNPGASIQFTTNSYTNQVYLLMGIDNYTEYFVKVSNTDVVKERLKLTAQPSDTYFHFKYYLCDAGSTNEITSSITSISGYTTSYLSTNVVIIKTAIETTTNIYGGLNEDSFIEAAPLKNLTLITQFNVSLTIVGGIPDVYAKDLEGNTVGSNVFATINSFTEKIENGETNFFKIYLRNTGSTNSDLTLKEDSFYFTGDFYRYYYDATTNNEITSSVTNGGLDITILSNSITNIILKVVPNTNAVSSNFCGIRLKLYLTHYTNRRDYFSLTNILVNPQVDLKITTRVESSWNISNYDESSSGNPSVITTVANLGVSFYIAVVNKDKVMEDMIMQATAGNALWEVSYYDDEDNDITSKIISSGYTNRNIIGDTNFFSLIRCTVIPSSEVSLTDSFNFTVQAVTKKNLSRMDMVYGRVNINSFILKGKVLNKKTKEPIPGAKISSRDGLGRVVQTYSDANGDYELAIYPVYDLKNSLTAEASGYVSDEKTLYPSSVTNYLNFELVSLNMSSDKFDERMFPNPINSGDGGTLVYAVAKDSHITLEMYDLFGRLIKDLVDEDKQKGVYYIKWDGKDNNGDIVPRGVYIFVMDAGDEVVRKKVFIK